MKCNILDAFISSLYFLDFFDLEKNYSYKLCTNVYNPTHNELKELGMELVGHNQRQDKPCILGSD